MPGYVFNGNRFCSGSRLNLSVEPGKLFFSLVAAVAFVWDLDYEKSL